MVETVDYGFINDGEFFDRVLPWKGKQVVDVGCSDGMFSKMLAARGATVLGLEPDAVAVKRHAEAPPVENLTIKQAGAESMPVEDASQDVVVFKFSLHHVPAELHAASFKEAARVLKPGGKLLVIEPAPTGDFHHVMCPFHDETAVRIAAQESLSGAATEHFSPDSVLRYQISRSFASYDDYVKLWEAKLSFNTFTLEDVKNEETKKRFLSFTPVDGKVTLIQPVKADLFTKKD